MIDLSKLEKTKVIKDLGLMNVLIYGPPKVGKSTLASQIPNALFCATEKGHNFLEIFKHDVASWEEILDLCSALAAQKHTYKTLVIDIVDYFYKYCERFVIGKEKVKDKDVDHVSDLDFGKGYALVKDEFTRVVTKINAMGLGITFISHAKEKEQSTKTAKWSMMQTSMGNTPQSVVSGLCDLILYCYIREDGSRVMRTKPTKYVLAGDRSKKLPELMPMNYALLTEYLAGTKKADLTLSDEALKATQQEQTFKTQEPVKLKNHAPGAEGGASV